MKEDLIKLIDSQKDIEKLFHKTDGNLMSGTERIHDVQEFQDWLMEIKFELQTIYDQFHDQYVWETINVCSKNMNGVTDRKIFSEIIGRLKVIHKNIKKYYPEDKKSYQEGAMEK